MAEQVHVSGLAELSATLRRLPDNLQRSAIDKALRQSANLIRDEARRRAPVLAKPDRRRRAGTLRRAIAVRKRRGTRDIRLFAVYVRRLSQGAITRYKARTGKSGADNPNDPFYARFVELGTSKMGARPYLRPAFDAKAHQAIDRFTATVRDWLSVEANFRR